MSCRNSLRICVERILLIIIFQSTRYRTDVEEKREEFETFPSSIQIFLRKKMIFNETIDQPKEIYLSGLAKIAMAVSLACICILGVLGKSNQEENLLFRMNDLFKEI